MSSDPISDLARCTLAFETAFRETLTRNPRPAPGSPAEAETEDEALAGGWSEHSARDTFATAYLLTASCTDHLLGLADILVARNAVFAAYTVTRAATEAAALGCYLADPAIDARERVRRSMNYRLYGFSERVWMLTDLKGDRYAVQLAETRDRLGEFARSARQKGFTFTEMDERRRRHTHIGEAEPAAMQLVSIALAEDEPELGRLYQRLLSATAHSSMHGLARMLGVVAPNDGRPGEVIAAG
jgi:hypothetical protein